MKLKATYEEPSIHAHWEAIYRSNPVLDRLNDAIMERIIQSITPAHDALFLDAGCGVGDHTFRIAQRGYRCVGVDVSEYILQLARQNATERGFTCGVNFVCQALEELSFPDGVFDVVHCRGVLMHIPEWEKALGNLCRVLKPKGKIVIMESNSEALEIYIVKLIRLLTTRRSNLVTTPGGLEFWSQESGRPFVFRVANIKSLVGKLEECGVRVLSRFGTSFLGSGRFPEGLIRNSVIRFDRLYFHLRFPAWVGIGNAIVGEKI